MRSRRLVMGVGVLAIVALLVGATGAVLAQTPARIPGWGLGGMMGGQGMFVGPAMINGQGMMGGAGMMQGRGMMGGQGMMGPRMGMTGDTARWFIVEMIPHHEDAVTMAELALIQAEHPELKDLAAAIKETQTREIEQMRQWYQQWYGTPPPASTMAGHMRVMHNPSAIDGQRPFDKAFIEQMIPHHQMAVMMATHALSGVTQPELRALLQSIITSQSAEIAQMSQWYQIWYGTLPPVGMGMMGGRMGTP
jgi:uncharacterized protein (DUF305 family)